MNNNSRIPLHLQFDLSKAQKKNPSWESFREHRIHDGTKYQHQGSDRPSTHAMSVIRRNPNGELDYNWAKHQVINAIHGLQFHGALIPLDQALLTVIFPEKFKAMEPMQADILTQFSASEKAKVRKMVEAHMNEEENWNAGYGGGSVEGRFKTRDGIP